MLKTYESRVISLVMFSNWRFIAIPCFNPQDNIGKRFQRNKLT